MSFLATAKRLIRRWRANSEDLSSPEALWDKSAGGDFLGRFREVISDPLNVLIKRDYRAGRVENGMVWLHNGNLVPFVGKQAYYGRFSELLVINRGVHEPLEEFAFQELMQIMPQAPMMLELGAYWGHYSMWLKRTRPNSKVILVEPVKENIDVGKANFKRHGFQANFILSPVDKHHFQVDRFLMELGYPRLNILHSDIQGYEVEMLQGATESFRRQLIDYTFISTHSQILHDQVIAALFELGMRVEISSGFDEETTSFDGFVFASSPAMSPVFPCFSPLGRREIMRSDPEVLVTYLSEILNAARGQRKE
jgi:Methyltransferase FkbM domain